MEESTIWSRKSLIGSNMLSVRMFIFLIGLSVLAAFVVLIWLNTTSKSVLWSYKEKASVSAVPYFVIFNPFREKQSETEAEKILVSIKNGRCKEIIKALEDKDRYRSLCENVAENNLKGWKLVFRKDNKDSVTLFYQTKSTLEEKFDGEIGVTLNNYGEEWRLQDIGPIY